MPHELNTDSEIIGANITRYNLIELYLLELLNQKFQRIVEEY